MTVKVTPLPEKINPDPDHTNNVDADNKRNRFPFHLLIMMPTTIGSFVRSYRRNDNDYLMAVFSLLVFSVFILVDYFLVWFIALAKNEKSSQKFWLKVTLWFLNTDIIGDWKIMSDAGKSNHAYSVLEKV
ncbi:hypothetical protein HanPSC8_Chr17g0753611 [Helianthus annuus]|nr:hypothetical protein HanPSC8_Chr17g0753611 [Helianthus annuus]